MNTTWSYMAYATFALGGLAVYFMMPRSGRSTKTAGAILGVAGLAAAMVLCASRFSGTSGGGVFFYLSAVVVVGSAAKVITHEKPVYSALYFVLTVLAITPLLVLQEAEFLAVALVIIYAGAILVTYVFVIMLSQQSVAPAYDRRARDPLLAVFAGFLTMAVIVGQMTVLPEGSGVSVRPEAVEVDNTIQVGRVMMSEYVVGLEVAGVLLLIAMVGAIAISRKPVDSEEGSAALRPPGEIGKEVAPF